MTTIEWTEKTWNPLVGCSITSPGCKRCYAMSMAARIERMNPELEHYRGLTEPSAAGPVWTGTVRQAPEHILTEPLRRKKPTTWFVNSMSDLFHKDFPRSWVEIVFAVMALTPQHTYQVLTKRSDLMMDFICHADEGDTIDGIATEAARLTGSPCAAGAVEAAGWPLKNVWLGVSAERQQEADARVPDLLATPAAVRFVSAEPLLGPVDFKPWLRPTKCATCSGSGSIEAWGGYPGGQQCPDCENGSGARRSRLSWVIVGGESGPSARPMHPDWARSIRDQCAAAGVPFFFKQWGAHAWTPDAVCYTDAPRWGREQGFARGTHFEHHSSGHTSFRVGKARAGRLLDGREHNDMPVRVATREAA